MNDFDLILKTCAELYQQDKELTLATVKFKIPKSVPFPELAKAVHYFKGLSAEDKNKLNTSDNKDNADTPDCAATSENKNETLANHAEKTADTLSLTDDAFLALDENNRMLYLKHLLENILLKQSKQTAAKAPLRKPELVSPKFN